MSRSASARCPDLCCFSGFQWRAPYVGRTATYTDLFPDYFLFPFHVCIINMFCAVCAVPRFIGVWTPAGVAPRIVSREVRERLERSTFMVVVGKMAIGVGFFVKDTVAVTARHNLGNGWKPEEKVCQHLQHLPKRSHETCSKPRSVYAGSRVQSTNGSEFHTGRRTRGCKLRLCYPKIRYGNLSCSM